MADDKLVPIVPVIDHHPTNETLDFLDARIYEHNGEQTGCTDGNLFTIVMRNGEGGGDIIAGISGWTWAQASEIRILWVHADYRRHGYGSQLLQLAEQEARARGCKVICLSSYSFQAPDFYVKHGFEIAFQLNDFPPGHHNVYLVKRLS